MASSETVHHRMLVGRLGVGGLRRSDSGCLMGWVRLEKGTLFYVGPWIFGFTWSPRNGKSVVL